MLMLFFFVIDLLLVVVLKLLLKLDNWIDRETQGRREETNQFRLKQMLFT